MGCAATRRAPGSRVWGQAARRQPRPWTPPGTPRPTRCSHTARGEAFCPSAVTGQLGPAHGHGACARLTRGERSRSPQVSVLNLSFPLARCYIYHNRRFSTHKTTPCALTPKTRRRDLRPRALGLSLPFEQSIRGEHSGRSPRPPGRAPQGRRGRQGAPPRVGAARGGRTPCPCRGGAVLPPGEPRGAGCTQSGPRAPLRGPPHPPAAPNRVPLRAPG